MTVKISPTLLDAYSWYINAPYSLAENKLTWKEKALIGLKNRLNKIYSSSPEMEKGIKFEKFLCDLVINKKSSTNDLIQKGIDFIKEGAFQKKFNLNIKLNNLATLKISGIMDVLTPTKVVDIKTTNKLLKDYKFKSKKEGYIEHKHQHYIYYIATGLPFYYMVYQFENKESKKILGLDFFEYSYTTVENTIQIIKNQTVNFFLKLKELHLIEDYFNNYNSEHSISKEEIDEFYNLLEISKSEEKKNKIMNKSQFTKINKNVIIYL